jgi:hypothetical protein
LRLGNLDNAFSNETQLAEFIYIKAITKIDPEFNPWKRSLR